jgi:hypothetical protein
MADFEQDESKADISSLLEVNRLDYRLPPSLSIATSRAMKVYRSQQQEYIAGGQQLQFTLSSGATYCDFLNSFLKFKAKMPDTLDPLCNPKFSPHTGWINLVEQIRIVHSSGVELDRTKNSVGEWIQIQNYYERSEQNRKTQGALYSLNDTCRPSGLVHTGELMEHAKQGKQAALGANGAYLTNSNPQGREFDVCIPLAQLCGFFNVDLLAPSFLAAGLQIHIDLYPPEHFFVCGSGDDGEQYLKASPEPVPATDLLHAWPSGKPLVISNPEMHLETFTLTDSIVRKLSQISASSGLEWYFDAVHQMDGNNSGSDYSMQITRALSRANNVIVKTRLKSDIANTYADSFGSQPWVTPISEGGGTVELDKNVADVAINGAMKAFQVQLGAQYIPSRSLKDKKEFIHSALKTFSQFRRSDELGGPDTTMFGGFRSTRYTTAEAKGDKYFKGLAIAAIPLESSSTLQQSGAAISAQRTAVVNMTWEDSPSGVDSRKVDAFVVYSKLATLFLDSVVVRS